jgi:hypothetical protein
MVGAGEGNRTLLMSLGSSGNATIRRPQDVRYGAESTVSRLPLSILPYRAGDSNVRFDRRCLVAGPLRTGLSRLLQAATLAKPPSIRLLVGRVTWARSGNARANPFNRTEKSASSRSSC